MTSTPASTFPALDNRQGQDKQKKTVYWSCCRRCLLIGRLAAPTFHQPKAKFTERQLVWRTSKRFWLKKICLLAVTINPHLMPIWPPPPSPQKQSHPLSSAAAIRPHVHLSLDLLDFFHLRRLCSPLPLEFLNRLSAPTSCHQTYVPPPHLPPLGLFISKGWLLTQQPAASPHLCWRSRTNISGPICWCFSPSDCFRLFSQFSQPARLNSRNLWPGT